jgi:subtilisin family serine protease
MLIIKRAGHKLPGWCVLPAAALMLAAQAGAADAQAKIDSTLANALAEGERPFFVMFGERTPLAPASTIANWAERGRFVVDQLKATANRSQGGARAWLKQRGVAFTPFWVENKIYIRKGTLELARALAKRAEVAGILPETTYALPMPAATTGSTAPVGWNIQRIGAPEVWTTYGNNGVGVVVANIDTGVQYTHPSLVKQYRGNLGAGFNHAGNWHDPAGLCAQPCDVGGHGTHTMGIMVGDDGGMNRIGVAPGAKWIACKGCNGTECAEAQLTACAQWIMEPNGQTANRPNIVNNSWAGQGANPWYRPYIQNWIAAGIFPAFAIGNSPGGGCASAGSPGDYPEAFASGATDMNDNVDASSARGPSPLDDDIKPDVTAPGTAIYSSFPTNSYLQMTGTSMASPHTAGTVALLWAARPEYLGNIAATELLLTNNATTLTTIETCGGLPEGAIPNNTFGSGRIDAKRTIDAGGALPPSKAPVVTITTPSADAQQFNCGTPVLFSGTASDPQDGDLSHRILWQGPGIPAAERGASIYKSFKCDSPGLQIITAKVQDSRGLKARDSIVVNIVNPGKPEAPTNLVARLSGNTVTLTWTDNSAIERGFKVFRRVGTGNQLGPWLLRKRIDVPNTTTFQDTITAPGRYRYYVKAFNAEGESTPSNTVIVDK